MVGLVANLFRQRVTDEHSITAVATPQAEPEAGLVRLLPNVESLSE